MPHHDLRFELFVEFERDRDDDQHTRGAERVGHAYRTSEQIEQERRYDRDYRQEQRPEKGDPVVDLCEIFAGRLAAPHTLDDAAVLLQVARNVDRVELYLRIEVCEEDDQQEHHDVVHRCAGSEILQIERHDAVVLRYEGQYHLREHHERRSEDDGHDAAAVDLHRDVGRLSAVHLVALDLLCVVDLDAALRPVDEHDEEEEQHHDEQVAEDVPNVVGLLSERRERADQRGRKRRDDTDEDDHRRAVADALLRDALRKPHDESGTCGHEHDDDRAADGFAAERGLDSARVVIGHDDADALHDAEQNGDVSGDLGHLRPALFALLGEPFERGYDQCQQLHDDEAVDERQYAECKQRTVSERAARHHVDDLEQRVASVAVDRRGDRREIKTGNGDVAAYPVHQQDRKRKEYFVAEYRSV